MRCGDAIERAGRKQCNSCLQDSSRIMRTYLAENGPRVRERNTKWRRSITADVIDHYGGACACCGEVEHGFLTIDHPNNDGGKERIRLFGDRGEGGFRFYLWLRKNDYPAGYRVLCYNCNCARGRLGYCPHEKT